jgi:amidase
VILRSPAGSTHQAWRHRGDEDRDASNDVFSPADKTVSAKIDLTKVNPQTGPFYVEGAEPGDTLVVHIDSIDLNRDFGWGASIPGFGLLAPEYKTAMVTPTAPDRLFVWHLDKNRKVGTLDLPNSKIGKVEVPLRPFFGTIGTAPAGKECISSLNPGPHGANMDFNEVVAGVTMHFPVFEPGALFMLGDGHAAQGDGEIGGAAIETSFDVKFTVNLIKGKKTNWPHLINDNEIMSIGSTRPLIDALRLACVDLVDWLVSDYGFEKYEAVELLGQTSPSVHRQRGRSAVLGGLRAEQEVLAEVGPCRSNVAEPRPTEKGWERRLTAAP